MINGFEINGTEINGSGSEIAQARIAVDSPLGAVALRAFHDWSAAIPASAVYQYLLDIDGDTTIRLPMNSWQATLRADSSSYVAAVIPNAGSYAAEIAARTGNDFVITRRAVLPGGSYIDQEIARAPLQSPRFAQGPTRYSCSISGYALQFYTPESPEASTTRTLPGVQSITSGDEFRARCGIDWFLRPGQQAIANGETFTVSYMNFYVNKDAQYMDVGGVAA